MVRLFAPVAEWYCPNCKVQDQTRAMTTNRYHVCAGLRGLTAPMLRKGVKAKVESREREDYLGNDIPQTDANGRPVMSIVTTREDGQDTIVLAPTSVARIG